MQESVTYQAILEEGRQDGRQEGRQEGIQIGFQDGCRSIVINLLREGAEIEMIQKVSGMSIEAIQQIQAENLA